MIYTQKATMNLETQFKDRIPLEKTRTVTHTGNVLLSLLHKAH